MAKLASYSNALRAAALATLALAAVSAPSTALANRKGGSNFDSTVVYWGCFFGGGNPAYCHQMAKVEDPPTLGITSLSLTEQFDPSLYTFNAAESGPLGLYAVGGDQLPVTPGVGTEPFLAMPGGSITPGAPLPGSTLTYTLGAGTVTVDYQLASPLTSSTDDNWFLLMFDLVHPQWIDFPDSTVTYETTGPGADFTKTNFSCVTTDGLGCGSDFPTSGLTINYAPTPEPAVWTMLLMGFFGLGLALRAASIGSQTTYRQPRAAG